jgi:ParB-like chromosome segregation protein Spo0J
MSAKVKKLAIVNIRNDGGTQPRDSLAGETIKEYRDAMEDGAVFPPVIVFYDGSTYWLADGYHRMEALCELGREHIQAEVHQGTQRDAVLYSVGANALHGLPRTNADKRRAVECLLRDAEWSQWSDREIARRCVVSHWFVAKVRPEVAPSGSTARYDASTETPTDPSPPKRKYERGGKTHEQKPRAKKAEKPKEETPADDEGGEVEQAQVSPARAAATRVEKMCDEVEATIWATIEAAPPEHRTVIIAWLRQLVLTLSNFDKNHPAEAA